jgi:hypothetical protein
LKLTGAAVLALETAAGSGVGKVQWRTAAQTEFPEEGQVVEFTIPDGGPQKTEVKLPVDGQLVHVRVYLPAQTQPVVVVERIGLTATGGYAARLGFWEVTRWREIGDGGGVV